MPKEKEIEELKRICVILAKRAGVKKYKSKYSKRTFSQHDHIIMLTLREIESRSYREFVDWLNPEKLNVSHTPHFTTPHKAGQRFANSVIALLVEQCISLLRKKALRVGVDSTGFGLSEGSTYYTKRCVIVGKKKRYLKFSIACELSSMLVLSTSIHKAWRNDNRDFLPLLAKLKGKKLSFVSADKAYDSNANRAYIIQELNSKPEIPIRGKLGIHPGYYRKRAKLTKAYHQRSKVETAFSVMKRLYKPNIKAKKAAQQRKELLLKTLAYNIRRLSKIIVLCIKA
jgi:transposase